MTIFEFSGDVRTALLTYVEPAIVQFRGSLATNSYDEFSDVDLEARVSVPLDDAFFVGLTDVLKRNYGPALVRYDPDYKHVTTAQDVRFSFYDLPVFWRVDLLIQSDRESERKYPNPFPHWASGTSALMNIIWAVKYSRRGRTQDADHYVGMACEKLGLGRLKYTSENALLIVNELAHRDDVDAVILGKTRQTINGR
jgi:hypothetical protein